MHLAAVYLCLFVSWTAPEQLLKSFPVIFEHSIRLSEVTEHLPFVAANTNLRVAEDDVIRVILHYHIFTFLRHREHLNTPIANREDKPWFVAVLLRYEHSWPEPTNKVPKPSANKQKQVLLVVDVLMETCLVSLV